MIEIIYKDEKQEAKGNEGIFSVPRNIRQVGLIDGDCRIYMEDYVYTFLTKSAGEGGSDEPGKSCLAVLTGETKWASGVSYVFIRGALSVEAEELSAEHIEFTESLWQQIHEETEKYFQGQEITGWFFSEKSLPVEASELFQRVHLKHFGGEKVFMLMDPAEREEAFFRFENNAFVRQQGYYLYYEKNPQMQAYMIEKKPEQEENRQEEVPDEAVRAFRNMIQKKKKVEKRETEEPEERPSVFSYAATACLALAVIGAGAKFYQNYQSMQAVNARTEAVSAVIDQEEQEETPTQVSPEEEAKADKMSVEEETEAAEEKAAETSREKETEAAGNVKEEAAETEIPSPTPSGEEKADSAASDQVEDEAIYREESDVRKAEKRVREAKEQEEETAADNSGTEASESAAQTAASGKSYIIRPGDTLYQISLENYGSMDAVAEICSLNGISTDEIIYPGQIIVLP